MRAFAATYWVIVLLLQTLGDLVDLQGSHRVFDDCVNGHINLLLAFARSTEVNENPSEEETWFPYHFSDPKVTLFSKVSRDRRELWLLR